MITSSSNAQVKNIIALNKKAKEHAAGCFKCDPHAALHRRGGDGQRKDTASDGT